MSPSLPSAVLLVDGYNIIGSWTCLKKTRDELGLEAARLELVESMTSYSALEGYDTRIVFDAHQTPFSNAEVITEHLSVYYTDFGQTADTYIEKTCASLRYQLASATISRIIVATSDRAQQLTVQGYGAQYVSAQKLCQQVKTTCRMRPDNKKRQQSKGRFLANSIDPKSRQRLVELRMGLN